MDRADLETIARRADHTCAQRISWWPGVLEIRSPEKSVLDWARHHLTTREGAARRRDEHLLISALVEPRLASGLRAALAAGGTEQFFPYTGDQWELGGIGGCRAWARCEPCPATAVIEISPGHLLLVGSEATEVARSAVRVARESLRTELAASGAITLHASFAAGASLDGVLFVGPPGSGKTTLALALARTGSFVSGDQTEILGSAYGSTMGFGFPWPLRISKHGLESAGMDVDPRGLRRLRCAPPGKLEFTFVEASEMFELEVATDRPIAMVVIIEVASFAAAPAAYVSDLRSCTGELLGELREPDPALPRFWLAARDLADATYPELAVALDSLPVVRLAWDPSRHKATDALHAIGACR
jgi:hypothetical protein